MVHHQIQARFDRARWRVVVLAPVWGFQIVLALGLIGIFAFRLAETVDDDMKNHDASTVPIVDVV